MGWKTAMQSVRSFSGTVQGLGSLYSGGWLKFRLGFVFFKRRLEVTQCVYRKALSDSLVLSNQLCQNMTRCTCWVVKISKFHLIIFCTVLKGRQLKYWNSLFKVGFMPPSRFWVFFFVSVFAEFKEAWAWMLRRLMDFIVDMLNILGNITWNVGVCVGLK